MIVGKLEWKGLVIVRGQLLVDVLPIVPILGPAVTLFGSAQIYGSLWTEKVNFKANTTAQVLYSTQALGLADKAAGGVGVGVGGGGGGTPMPLRVTSLVDCSQVPPGVSRCPG